MWPMLILAGVIVIGALSALAFSGKFAPVPAATATTTVVGAPMWHTFSDLYTMPGMMGGGSMTLMDYSGNMVSVSPTQNYQSDSCSLAPASVNETGSGGSASVMTCVYLGVSYAGTVADSCNHGVPIQVNSEMGPDNSCILQSSG